MYGMAVSEALVGLPWWVAASAAACGAAQKRGRLRGPWLFPSLFPGPVFVVLVLIAYPPESVKRDGA